MRDGVLAATNRLRASLIRWWSSGSIVSRSAIALPWLLAAYGVGWWMTNVGFWVLGATNGRGLGYSAWAAGYRVPNWYRHMFPYAGVVAWIVLVVVIGGLIALRGRRAWWLVLGVGVVSTLVAAGISAAFGRVVWPHGF